MKFLTCKNVMFDIETAGQCAIAPILSIGAVDFTFSNKTEIGKIFSEFYINIDIEDSLKYGLKIDKRTIDWWSTQPKHIFNQLFNPKPVPLKDALELFFEWYKTTNASYIWGNGQFDIPFINVSTYLCGLNAPWDFRKEMDLRTVRNLLDAVIPRGNGLHNALEDAKDQTKFLMELFEKEPF